MVYRSFAPICPLCHPLAPCLFLPPPRLYKLWIIKRNWLELSIPCPVARRGVPVTLISDFIFFLLVVAESRGWWWWWGDFNGVGLVIGLPRRAARDLDFIPHGGIKKLTCFSSSSADIGILMDFLCVCHLAPCVSVCFFICLFVWCLSVFLMNLPFKFPAL